MIVKVYKFSFICLLMFLGMVACSRQPLVTDGLVGDAAAGRAAWARIVKLESLKANSILSWKATDGRRGKYKVRLFLEPPKRFKIQWLTPWGSVAGQILMAADQFWLSDSRRRLTWYGPSADLENLLRQKNSLDWAMATQFFMYWPLLFSTPEEDDAVFKTQAFIDYLTTNEGRSLHKIVRFKDGDEMHIRLDDLETDIDGRLFARNFEVLGSGGQISLSLRQFTLQKDLAPETFVYSLENFRLLECSIPEGDNHVGE